MDGRGVLLTYKMVLMLEEVVLFVVCFLVVFLLENIWWERMAMCAKEFQNIDTTKISVDVY